MANVYSDLVHRPRPLRMTTGPEGPAAGRREKISAGGLCEKDRLQGKDDQKNVGDSGFGSVN